MLNKQWKKNFVLSFVSTLESVTTLAFKHNEHFPRRFFYRSFSPSFFLNTSIHWMIFLKIPINYTCVFFLVVAENLSDEMRWIRKQSVFVFVHLCVWLKKIIICWLLLQLDYYFIDGRPIIINEFELFFKIQFSHSFDSANGTWIALFSSSFNLDK